MPIEKNTTAVAIVEDSSNCARQHQQYLRKNGVSSIVFRNANEFEEFVSLEKKKKKANRIKAVITDGLEGNWKNVVSIAQKNSISSVWLITGNDNFIIESRSFPGVKSMHKAELYKDPEKYKKITE